MLTLQDLFHVNLYAALEVCGIYDTEDMCDHVHYTRDTCINIYYTGSVQNTTNTLCLHIIFFNCVIYT